jgi:hypothetical protein
VLIDDGADRPVAVGTGDRIGEIRASRLGVNDVIGHARVRRRL